MAIQTLFGTVPQEPSLLDRLKEGIQKTRAGLVEGYEFKVRKPATRRFSLNEDRRRPQVLPCAASAKGKMDNGERNLTGTRFMARTRTPTPAVGEQRRRRRAVLS